MDITGQRFGKLTALHIVRKGASGNRWLCLCDCGEFAVRTAGALSYAIKNHRVSQCVECRGRAASQRGTRRLRRSYYARLFAHTGQLWSWKSEERLIRGIAHCLDAEGWRAPPYEEIRLPVAGYSLLDAIEMRSAAEAPRSAGERAKRRVDARHHARTRQETNYREQRKRDLEAYAKRESQWPERFRARL
jgi:hypothetical protein